MMPLEGQLLMSMRYWMNQRGATEHAPATLRELGNDLCVLV